jgi:hypothetical protein
MEVTLKGEHRLTQNDSWFLAKSKKDPMTFAPFRVGDVIVVCSKCKTPHMVSSWQVLFRCGACDSKDTLPVFDECVFGTRSSARFSPIRRAVRTWPPTPPEGATEPSSFRVTSRPSLGNSSFTPPSPPARLGYRRNRSLVRWGIGIIVAIVLAVVAWVAKSHLDNEYLQSATYNARPTIAQESLLVAEAITWADAHLDRSIECPDLRTSIEGSELTVNGSSIGRESGVGEWASWLIASRSSDQTNLASGPRFDRSAQRDDYFVWGTKVGQVGGRHPGKASATEGRRSMSRDGVDCTPSLSEPCPATIEVTCFRPDGAPESPCSTAGEFPDNEQSRLDGLTYSCTMKVS